MKRYLIILLVLFYSCIDSDNEIYYSYKDVIIKRIDVAGETSFYYMNKESGSTSRIWAEYSGINDGFSGYLEFGDNGKVMLLSGDEYFQSENVDTTKFTFRRILAYQRPDDLPSVYYINLSTGCEKERNANTGTKVIATYKKTKQSYY